MTSEQYRKYLTAAALVKQGEALLKEEIGTRYAYEMARKRPSSERVQQDIAQKEQALKMVQWQSLQLESIIESITGKSVEEVRTIVEDIETVIARKEEVEQELRHRRLLTPTLVKVLEAESEIIDKERIERDNRLHADAMHALAEIPRFEKHFAFLVETLEELLGKLKYNDVSDIEVVSSLVVSR